MRRSRGNEIRREIRISYEVFLHAARYTFLEMRLLSCVLPGSCSGQVGRCQSKGVTNAHVDRLAFSLTATLCCGAFPRVPAARLWLDVLGSCLPHGDEHPTLSEVRSISTGASRTYLGAVNGTRALLGIVLDGAQVRAYVCDGTPSRLARLAEWFDGPVKSNKVQESSQDQQVQLSALLTEQRASGTLRLASGRVYPFSLPQVPATARVGVFEGTATISGQRYHAGWLRLAGGDQHGAATYFPSSPIRGQIVIARLSAFPSSPI
jgi:hypothetical protein